MEIAEELLLGVILVAVSVVAFWFALPRDGKVRSLLRTDQRQTYYVVVVLGALAYGIVNLFKGLAAMLG
jgi:hypothetical protein